MVEKLRIVGCAILKRPTNQFFTLDQIIEITGLSRIGVRRILERFSRERLVLKITKMPNYFKGEIAPPKGRPPLAITYHVAAKKKLSDRVAPKLKEGTAQDRMWSVIWNKSEMEGCFTLRDVVILAAVGRENARWYLKMLRRAGFVRPSKARGRGVYWRLIKDPGPKRPYVSGRQRVESKSLK